MKRSNRAGTQGFTLVELIIVIVIIGILAAIAVPQFTNVTANAKQANYAASAAAVQSQITALFAANSSITTSCSGLVTELSNAGFNTTNSALGGAVLTLPPVGTDATTNRCTVTYAGFTPTNPVVVNLPWK